MKKRILALGLTVAILFGGLSDTVYAIETTQSQTEDSQSQADPAVDEAMNTGLIETQGVELPETEGEDSCGYADTSVQIHPASAYDKYSSFYWYNHLDSDDERDFYNRLDNMAYRYLTSSADIVGPQTGYSEAIPYGYLDIETAYSIFLKFKYSNPQYYFISAGYGYNSANFYFSVYPAFINGSQRTNATSEFMSAVQNMEQQVIAQPSELEKEAKIYELLCRKVSYDDNFNSMSSTEFSAYDKGAWTQSAYSTFCTDTTVCAGYSLAFEMLCNAVGIDCIAVLSSNHAWNKVRMNSTWYSVDATWGDQADGYYCLNVSDDYYGDHFSNGEVAHTPSDAFDSYDPYCDIESGSTQTTVGTLYVPAATMETPTLIQSQDSGTSYMYLTFKTNSPAISSQEFYYTVDGSIPSVTDTRCESTIAGDYGSQVYLWGDSNVKVINTCNGYRDSAYAAGSYQTLKYTLTFNSQGGTAVTAQRLEANDYPTEPAAPTRAGYKFGGWYANAACTQAFDFYSLLTANKVAYAKWIANSKQVLSGTAKYTKKYGDKAFTINTKIKTGNGKLTYTSNNRKVAVVSSRGKVTIKGVGTAKITITAAASGKYKKVSKSVTIVVNPKGTAFTQLKATGKTTATVKYRRNSAVNGYQVQYSTSSKFKGAKTVTVKSNKTTTAKLNKLTKNKKYYVRIRTYKKVSGKNYYSSWSGKKTVTTKKK